MNANLLSCLQVDEGRSLKNMLFFSFLAQDILSHIHRWLTDKMRAREIVLGVVIKELIWRLIHRPALWNVILRQRRLNLSTNRTEDNCFSISFSRADRFGLLGTRPRSSSHRPLHSFIEAPLWETHKSSQLWRESAWQRLDVGQRAHRQLPLLHGEQNHLGHICPIWKADTDAAQEPTKVFCCRFVWFFFFFMANL